MDGDIVQEITSLAVILADAAIFVTGNDVLVHVAPASDSGLGLVTDNGEDLLVALLGIDIRVDIDDDNVTEVSHTLFRDTKKLGAVLVELDTLDCGGELPGLEAAASLDVPETHGVVGGARGDHGGGRVDIDSPDSTDMAVVGSKTLAIVREPRANLLILRDGEDDIAIEIVAIFQNKGNKVSRNSYSKKGKYLCAKLLYRCTLSS